MSILTTIVNSLNAAFGRKQAFDDLLANKDIDRLIRQFQNRDDEVEKAINEYDVTKHKIMARPPKFKKNKRGEILGEVKQWKLPIPYQKYINEIALVFLYGQPLKFSLLTEEHKEAFSFFKDTLKNLRFDSRIRQAKRLAGAETESALLLHLYRNDENKPDALLKVLAKSKGDILRPLFDSFDRMIAFGRGYYVKHEGISVFYFDIYTKDKIYNCRKLDIGWEVIEEKNPIGKIPVIYMRQEAEHADVQELIDREEYIASITADVNDYFASPAAKATADVIENLPDKGEPGKLFLLANKDSVLEYLEIESAPELKKQELDYLEKQILNKSFTPKIDFESMKGLSNTSAKALKQMMVLAEIKAKKHQEVHDELIDRFINLIKAAIANVLDIKLAGQVKDMIIDHSFQSPFAEDVVEIINNLIKSVEVNLMSEETAREMHPLISDSTAENERVEKEREGKAKRNSEYAFREF